MRKEFKIEINRNAKKFKRRLKSKKKRKNKRIQTHKRKEQHRVSRLLAERALNGDFSLENRINNWMPKNILNLVLDANSQFSGDSLVQTLNDHGDHDGKFFVPEDFSLIENPEESYRFIRLIFGTLLFQTSDKLFIDYAKCKNADLGAQVLLDIIQKDILEFYKRCRRHPKTRTRVTSIGGRNIMEDSVSKMLFSVGSPAIHNNEQVVFKDIIPYKLCIHDRSKNENSQKVSEQKDIDTTKLVDYVLECLKRMDKHLSPEKLDDLCIVISEILINAEEHSSTKKRYSIGYFQELNEEGEHYGVFRLAILNFGNTIYDKFKSPNCQNQSIVKKMNSLSKEYTRKKIFKTKKFEEETLWTLYSLQEGVTSVSPFDYKKRGNGSIRFIESFFNIKGGGDHEDYTSKMAILSGNTSIVFDGKYKMTEKFDDNGDKFQYMTFNDSGNIEEEPDKSYVKYVKNNFPGTLISAKILFNDKDFEYEIE